jgi:hypothetical protein
MIRRPVRGIADIIETTWAVKTFPTIVLEQQDRKVLSVSGPNVT